MLRWPNSVISMAVVTNHSRPKGPHHCVIRLNVDLSVSPSRVIALLKATASASRDISAGATPEAYACEFSDSLVVYELAFAIDSFALTPGAKSNMLLRVGAAFQESAIPIGAQPMDVRIIKGADIALGDSRSP